MELIGSLTQKYAGLLDFLNQFFRFLGIGFATFELDAAHLVSIFLEGPTLAHEEGLVEAGGVEEDHAGLFDRRFLLLHVVRDVLLQKLLIFSPHLRTQTLDLASAAPISIQLSATLFAPHDVLGLAFVDNHFVVLVDLQGELASVAQNDHPSDHLLPQSLERREIRRILVQLDLLQNLLLPPHESGGVRKVDHVVVGFGQELVLFVRVLIVLLVIESLNEAFVHLDDVASLRVEHIHVGAVVIQAVELLQELEVLAVLRKLLEANLLPHLVEEVEGVDIIGVPQQRRNVENRAPHGYLLRFGKSVRLFHLQELLSEDGLLEFFRYFSYQFLNILLPRFLEKRQGQEEFVGDVRVLNPTLTDLFLFRVLTTIR